MGKKPFRVEAHPKNHHFLMESSFSSLYVRMNIQSFQKFPILSRLYMCWIPLWILLEWENSTAVWVKSHELRSCLDSNTELVTNQLFSRFFILQTSSFFWLFQTTYDIWLLPSVYEVKFWTVSVEGEIKLCVLLTEWVYLTEKNVFVMYFLEL